MDMFVAAGTSWMEGNCSVIEGESLALLQALNELKQWGVSHAIIEMDSKSLVDAIQHIHAGVSDFSFIVRQINNVLLFFLFFFLFFLETRYPAERPTNPRGPIPPSTCGGPV
jgi:hypothetical protein